MPASSSSSSSSSPTSAVGNAALVWPTASVHPRGFEQHALATLTAFQNAWRGSNASRLRRVDVDTWFWPVIQAGVLGIKEEERALEQVWQAVDEGYKAAISTSNSDKEQVAGDKGSEVEAAEARIAPSPGLEVDLTSGYFGLYKSYKKSIIASPAPIRIIAASPKVSLLFLRT